MSNCFPSRTLENLVDRNKKSPFREEGAAYNGMTIKKVVYNRSLPFKSTRHHQKPAIEPVKEKAIEEGEKNMQKTSLIKVDGLFYAWLSDKSIFS